VDLKDAPGNLNVQYGGIHVRRGVYAVIESTQYEPDPPPPAAAAAQGQPPRPPPFKSSMFTPIIKDTEVGQDGISLRPKFYLADVESITGTCCVIPDIGSANIFRYFVLTPRKQWSSLFVKWLKEPHYLDQQVMESSDEDEEDDDEEDDAE
jgi:hypothetical protein